MSISALLVVLRALNAAAQLSIHAAALHSPCYYATPAASLPHWASLVESLSAIFFKWVAGALVRAPCVEACMPDGIHAVPGATQPRCVSMLNAGIVHAHAAHGSCLTNSRAARAALSEATHACLGTSPMIVCNTSGSTPLYCCVLQRRLGTHEDSLPQACDMRVPCCQPNDATHEGVHSMRSQHVDNTAPLALLLAVLLACSAAGMLAASASPA